MGTDLADVFQPLARHRHQVLVDLQVNLALDLLRILPEQFEIRDQAAGSRILNGHDRGIGTAVFEGFEKVAESSAFHNPDKGVFPVPVEYSGGFLVKAAGEPLDSDAFFHFNQSRKGRKK